MWRFTVAFTFRSHPHRWATFSQVGMGSRSCASTPTLDVIYINNYIATESKKSRKTSKKEMPRDPHHSFLSPLGWPYRGLYTMIDTAHFWGQRRVLLKSPAMILRLSSINFCQMSVESCPSFPVFPRFPEVILTYRDLIGKLQFRQRFRFDRVFISG